VSAEDPAPADLVLFGFWRSSAAYRVRLALAFKGLDYLSVPVDLRRGIQSNSEFLALNPQGLVPYLAGSGLEDGLAQSLAIMEYLNEVYPSPPLLPADALGRARVRAAAQMVACDIHPLNNLRVLRYLKSPLGHGQDEIDAWARHWIEKGLTALEAFAHRHAGSFLYEQSVTIADLCLVPQLANARRVDTDLSAFPRLCAIEAAVLAQDFSRGAHPDAQADRSGS